MFHVWAFAPALDNLGSPSYLPKTGVGLPKAGVTFYCEMLRYGEILGGGGNGGGGDRDGGGSEDRRRLKWNEKYRWDDPLLPNIQTSMFEAIVMILLVQ